jgi:hypothetical protein
MVSQRLSLIKPKLTSPFKIDFEWWQKNDRDWRVYLRSFLCEEHQILFEDIRDDETIDWIDPKTAEVTQVDGLLHILMTHCAKQESFLNSRTTLVDSVFRLLLANGNKPLTPEELSEILNKPASIILRTLSGMRIYKGIRPVQEE